MVYKLIFCKRFKNHAFDLTSRAAEVIYILLHLFLYLSIYKVVYRDQQSFANVPYCDLAAYLTLSISLFNSVQLNGVKLAHLVSSGKMPFELLKPYSYALKATLEAAADFCANIFLHVLPVFTFGVIALQMRLPDNLAAALLSCFAFALGAFVFIGIQITMQMFGFWMYDIYNLFMPLKSICYILGGVIIPYWFLPSLLAKILMCTPFAYIWHLPMEIYLGNVSSGAAYVVIALQLLWIAVFALLIRKLSIAGKRSLQAAK